jgi:secreted trypsin-like serine protease
MKNTRNNNNNNQILLWIIILFGNIDSSYQIVYSCNTSELCGCSTNSAILTKIVGGESASTATWSWAVSISIAGSYLCGGSIVSSSWVITAAHCVKDFQASQITIYAGSILRWSGSQNRVASHIFVHPNYNSVSYVNDIALLHLTSPLIMSDSSVSAICLQFVQSTVVLSIEEWPPANTTVSNSLFFVFRTII